MKPLTFRSLTLMLMAIAFATNQKSHAASLQVGSIPPDAGLTGEHGGMLDGKTWDYREFLGRVQLIFYVDPDEREKGEALEDRLKVEHFPVEDVHSSAVINMAATGLPNFMIGMSLSSKQKKFPHATYAKDFSRQLVKTWGLQDDAYNFIILDRKGTVAYVKSGKLTDDEIDRIVTKIKALIAAK
ncbi:MAG: hypothetical protein RIQ81_2708 [Pseudomonadota bacterium]|jgi:predicted transcriptional regulator